jgi:hypothetical protein
MEAAGMDVIGKVGLNDSSECWFYVQEFKGKKFGSIRKFVDSEVYSGPTKNGVVLNVEGIGELVKLLEKVSPGTPDKELGKVQDQEEKYIAVQTSTFKEEQAIDIREYVDTETYSGPTKKGVRIPMASLKDVIGYLKTMADKLK